MLIHAFWEKKKIEMCTITKRMSFLPLIMKPSCYSQFSLLLGTDYKQVSSANGFSVLFGFIFLTTLNRV